MPRLVLAVLMTTAAFLQVAVLPRLAMLLVRPNLVLILVVLWTAHRGGREGAMWAFGAGVLLDALTLAPLGSHALALLAVVPIGVACRRSRFSLGLLLPMVGVLVGSLVYDAVLLVLQGETLAGLGLALTRVSLLSGLLSLALAPPLALVTTRLNRWLTRQEESVGRPRATRVAGRRR
jgi:rod shape-determining protein MreD